MEKKKSSLTAKAKRFCDEYLVSMNATSSAKKAGYSEKTAAKIGSENLQKPDIQAYLKERRQKEEEILGFSRITILQNLLEVQARCLQKSPVMVFDKIGKAMVQKTDDDGKNIWQFDSNGAIASAREISKLMGYEKPIGVDLTSKGEKISGGTVNIIQIPDNGRKIYDEPTEENGKISYKT